MGTSVQRNALRTRARQAARPVTRQSVGPPGNLGPIVIVADCGVGTPQVRRSETAELTFTLSNVGDEPGHYTVDFTVGGATVASVESSAPLLDSGSRSQTITFRPVDTPLQPGTYPVEANGVECADIQILADQPPGGGGGGGGNGGGGGGGGNGGGGNGGGGNGGGGNGGGNGGGGNGGGNGGGGNGSEGQGLRGGVLLGIAVAGALALGRLTG